MSMARGRAAARAVWAVVPVKGGETAKQRLAPVLAPAARRELARAMAERVLAALAGAAGIAGIVVVTEDAETAALARRIGAHVCSGGGGYTAAAATGAGLLAREGRGAMLCLPADLPLVTARDVERIVAARRRTRDFVIVPARDRGGTNAVLCAPPGAVPLRFGDDSFRRHLASAHRAAVRPRVLRLPAIAFDVDVPADLDELAAAWRADRANPP